MSGRVLGQDVGRVTCGAAAWAVASTVKPIHKPTVIVPDAEDQDHSPTEGLAHGGQTAEGGRRTIRRLAPRLGDRIKARGRFRIGDDLAVLDVLSSDLSQGTGLCAIVRDELSSDGEWLRSVDGTTRRPVVGQTLRVRIETTAALVAVGGAAGMGSVGIGHGVGLEDIHLITAVSLVTGVQGAVPPGLDWALCIAVSRAILGATSIVFIPSTGGTHLR